MSKVAQSITPATFTIPDLSAYVQRSIPSLNRDLAAGRLPPPIRIGKSLRFLKADVDEWLSLGCPSQAEFEQRRKKAR